MENVKILVIAIVLFVITIAVIVHIVSIFFIRHLKEQHEQASLSAKEHYNKRINTLTTTINRNNSHLNKSLKNRLELTRQINKIPKHMYVDIPKELWGYLNKLVYGKKQWNDFLHDYDGAHANTLTQLLQVYPLLTDTDLVYLTLMKLNMDSNDICYILKISDRTLWNRRYNIKRKIHMVDGDIEKWINDNIK